MSYSDQDVVNAARQFAESVTTLHSSIERTIVNMGTLIGIVEDRAMTPHTGGYLIQKADPIEETLWAAYREVTDMADTIAKSPYLKF